MHYHPRMSWPENALTEDEKIVSQFRPHWKLLAIPIVWFLLIAVGVFAVFRWVPGGAVIDLVLVLVLAAAFLWLVVKPVIDWYFTRYVLTTERLITRKGLISRHGVEIPLENITNVNFSQTIFERLLGAGDLLVESAGETGHSAFFDIPHPDRFQAVLYKVREQRTLELKGLAPSPDGGAESTVDPEDRLRRLTRLHDEGLITDEEYERKRRALLDDI